MANMTKARNTDDETIAVVGLEEIAGMQKNGYVLDKLIDTTDVITIREDAVTHSTWEDDKDPYSSRNNRPTTDPLCFELYGRGYRTPGANRSDDPRVASLYKQVVVPVKKAVMYKNGRYAEVVEQISTLKTDLSVAQQQVENLSEIERKLGEKIAAEKARADSQAALADSRLKSWDELRDQNHKMERTMAQIRRDLDKAKEYVGQKGWNELFPTVQPK